MKNTLKVLALAVILALPGCAKKTYDAEKIGALAVDAFNSNATRLNSPERAVKADVVPNGENKFVALLTMQSGQTLSVDMVIDPQTDKTIMTPK